jgi:hypothetical protein
MSGSVNIRVLGQLNVALIAIRQQARSSAALLVTVTVFPHTSTCTGLEGVDAFEKLKAQAAKASIQHPPKALELPMPKIPDPAIARAALEVTAREGLPVKGVNAKGWEDLRPKIVHDTRPAKVWVPIVWGLHVCCCILGMIEAVLAQLPASCHHYQG